jgi:dihydropteroate synthase
MQAYYLTPALLEEELKAGRFDPEKVDQLKKKAAYRTIKLDKIPPATLSSLQEAVASDSNNLSFSLISSNCNGPITAIISGSEYALYATATRLINYGKNVAGAGKIIKKVLDNLNRPRVESLQLGSHSMPLYERTIIMGILNVTPDSFSDGGKFDRLENALTQAYRMTEEGADIIDIGGESTRPGHKPVPAEEELQRVMPVINQLKKDHSFKTPLSIDTYKAPVAEEALNAGVEMLNDVWGLKEDSAISEVAARFGIPVCLMHNKKNTDYQQLIPDIIGEIEASIEIAHQAGIADKMIILDPGIGFGKNLQQNLEVMKHLPVLRSLGYPILLGTSRKSMIGKILDLPVEQRLEGTAATVAYGISAGVDIVRVHDVMAMRRVAVMSDAMVRR